MSELVIFVGLAVVTVAALWLLHHGQRGHDDGEPPTLDTRNHLDDDG